LRVMVVHNRRRSGAPSGENRVVDRERGALTSLGHEVIPFERNSDEIERLPLPKKAALPAKVVWNNEVYRDLLRVLREEQPDLVHVHNTFPLLSPAVLYACRTAAVPVVSTLHNKRLICAGGNFFRDGVVCHDCIDGPAIQAVVHGCYNRSRVATAPVMLATSTHRRAWRTMVSAYILLSESQRALLSSVGLDSDRVFVRHNLIPRRCHAFRDRDNSVLYVGRLDEPKGLPILMAGWDSYLRQNPETKLRLVIAGGGVLEGEVSAWAATRPSVDMIGYADEAQCAELMAKARAVLLPSACEETFGLAAVEAMAVGTPPVAAAHGAFVELITHGVDGMLFAPGDVTALTGAIADIEGHPRRYQAYGATARETYCKRFDPDRNLEQLLDIYRYAIKNPVFKS
jgi:glycosyltransferase involved in cell wall biosynthesis